MAFDNNIINKIILANVCVMTINLRNLPFGLKSKLYPSVVMMPAEKKVISKYDRNGSCSTIFFSPNID